jgi:hypothetical protein
LKISAGIMMVLVAGIMVRACIRAEDESTRGRPSTASLRPDTPEVPAQPPIAVTPEQLKREYDENEVAADQKYKGRTLLVDAVLSAIDKNFANDIVLRLRAGRQLDAVSATLDQRDAAQAAALKRGEAISLACRGGTRILGRPNLEDCRIR